MSSLAARQHSRGAAKVRAYRARQRQGLAVLRITVPEHAVIAFLVESGRLGAGDALDRRRVEAAAAEAVVELAARWLPIGGR